MIQINLLPVRAERRKELVRRQLSIAGLTLFLALTVMGLLYYRLNLQINRTRDRLQRTEKEIKKLEPVIARIEQFKQQKAEISKKINVIIDLDRLRPAPVVVLSDLNRLRPDKLWFASLKQVGGQLSLSGVAVDNETIVEFLDGLKTSFLLSQAELQLLRAKKFEDMELKEFTIECPVDSGRLPEALPPGAIDQDKPSENNHG
ncbi:MAG: PilN domain-containing protein [Deltaproteobacteria bacterium]|nr:PilN domain-containing protein [Deltaproteobacteria bacterium]